MTNTRHSRGEIRGFSIGHSTPAFSTKPNTTVFHIKAIFHHFVKNIFCDCQDDDEDDDGDDHGVGVIDDGVDRDGGGPPLVGVN